VSVFNLPDGKKNGIVKRLLAFQLGEGRGKSAV